MSSDTRATHSGMQRGSDAAHLLGDM